MTEQKFSFPNGEISSCIFGQSFNDFINSLHEHYFIVTDENIYHSNQQRFNKDKTIVIPAGETTKNQKTVDAVINELLLRDADKSSWLIGVGGGVVTDVSGYAASVFKRGMPLVLFPTSVLSMVDAALGGKNGVDVGMYKNMVGTVYQPKFIVYDFEFLNSLPEEEWINGFAEIIKHACIRDQELFVQLKETSLFDYRSNPEMLVSLIKRNVEIKMDIVTHDEFEKSDRKLLNFGHTIGHAIEKLHQIPHGYAIAVGMIAACTLSEKINGLHFEESKQVAELLSRYHLPVDLETDHDQVFDILKRDKKRMGNDIHFVLLDKIGEAHAEPVSLDFLKQHLKDLV